jgi:hypothetical protein
MSQLTPQQLIKALVAADGNIPLAAERTKVERGELIAAITAEQASLAEQLRSKFVLDLYHTLQETQAVFRMNLERMTPDAISRAYAQQAAAFAQLTSRPTEDASEQPVDIQAARNGLAARFEEYQARHDRRLLQAAESEEQATA